LTTFVTGKATIPKATIRYKEKGAKDWSQTQTAQQDVEVRSLLEKTGAKAQMRDIKGPVSLAGRFNLFWVFFSAGVIAAAAGLFVFFSRKKKESVLIPPRPAHEIAYEQLEELRRKNLIAQGKIKEYFIDISDIVRHYLENRFDLKAPEMTTEEFLTSVRNSSSLMGEHRNLLKEFLACCDLVKFAKYAPSTMEIDSVFESAKKFIDETREHDELP
jgi:hypothetical protein